MVREFALALRDVPREMESAQRNSLRIGGVSVEITGLRHCNMVSSLAPFQAETNEPDIAIHVDWLKALPSVPGRQLFDSGCTWRLFEEESGFRFEFYVAALGRRPYKSLRIDGGFSQARLQMDEQALSDTALALSPLEYPLDELLIMHRLTQERAIELHGCGIVGPDCAGNLFVGHSGAGKSTTARLWSESEHVEVLSDDRIIVRLDGKAPSFDSAQHRLLQKDARNGAPGDASRRSHSAQDDKTEKQIPRFARNDKPKYKMRMYGTPWHGEAAFASPGSAPLARIFILEHGRGNVLTRLSPSQAVAELFARSFVPFYRHEYLNSALEFLQDVADSIPCYRYAFEPDQRAVETILRLHE